MEANHDRLRIHLRGVAPRMHTDWTTGYEIRAAYTLIDKFEDSCVPGSGDAFYLFTRGLKSSRVGRRTENHRMQVDVVFSCLCLESDVLPRFFFRIMPLSGEQEKEKDVLRYKALVDAVNDTADTIANDSMTTDQRVSLVALGGVTIVLLGAYLTHRQVSIQVGWSLPCGSFESS